MQKAPETIIATDFKTHVLGHFFNQDQTLYNEKKNNNSGGAKDPNQPLPPRESLTAQTIFPTKVCGQAQSPTSTLPLGFFLPKSCRTKHKQLPHIPKTILQQPQRAGALPAQSQPPAKVCGQRSGRQVVVVVVHSSGEGETRARQPFPLLVVCTSYIFFSAKVKKY